jgi:hypothetical protein
MLLRKTRLSPVLAAILLILGILLMASSCQPAPTTTDSTTAVTTTTAETTASQTSLATTVESPFDTVREGIRFETTLNRDVYQSGDTIAIHVRVTNTTSSSMPIWASTWSHGAAGSLKIGIYVDGVTNAPLILADEQSMHDTMIYQGELAPGESIEQTARFTTTYHQDGETVAEVATGILQAVITFCRGSYDDEPIQISVPVRIDNTIAKLTKTVEVKGIRFEATPDRKVYRAGDIITIHVRVTNTTSEPIPIWARDSWYGASDSIKIGIYVDGMTSVPLISADKRSHSTDYTRNYQGELAAGASIEQTARFTTTFNLGGEALVDIATSTQQALIKFCRGSTDDEPIQISVPVRIENPAANLTWTAMREGLRFETTLDRNVYQSGDIIIVHVTITNATDYPIYLSEGSTPSGTAGSILIDALLDNNPDFPLLPSGARFSNNTIVILHGQLAAGASIEITAHFTTGYQLDDETIAQAWTGTHQIIVTLKRPGYYPTDTVQTRVPVYICGTGERLISWQKAQNLAKSTTEYADWADQHSGPALVKKKGGEYFHNNYGVWTPCSAEMYNQIITAPANVGISTSFQDGLWIVDCTIDEGDPPHQLTVKIDATQGTVKQIITAQR